jgi:hypothetical protein
MGSAFVFGKGTNTICIQDLRDLPSGEHACLAYQLDYYGLVFPGYVRDAGYAIKIGDHRYQHLDDALIAQYQKAGVLPDPLPPYAVPAQKYFWGFALWPMIIVLTLAAIFRRRGAQRRHARDQKPIAPGEAGIEIHATHTIFAFQLVAAAPTIWIDGEEHKRAWGTWTFPVGPGTHTIEIAYMWIVERGREKIEVAVEPREIKRLRYHVRPFLGSQLTAEASMPEARVEQIPGG